MHTLGCQPPYPPYPAFFSAWRWKVYDQEPNDQMSLPHVETKHCQGWITHFGGRFFKKNRQKEEIKCDVDENFWQNAVERKTFNTNSNVQYE